MTDPIADLLTRIRNALMTGKTVVTAPHSLQKQQLIEKLISLGYLDSFTVDQKSTHPLLHITLKYHQSHPVITNLKRISKPGRRIYVRADKIPIILSGFGSTILSTNQGLLTNKEAKKQGIGGELLCQIW